MEIMRRSAALRKGETMVFRVADPKFLSGIKESNKVRLTPHRVDGALTVTSIGTVGQ